MKTFSLSIIILSLIYNLVCAAGPEGEKKINKSFTATKKIKIELVLGDCILRAGTSGKIDVKLEYSFPDDDFEARFKEGTNSLIMEEKFHADNPRGHAFWDISIPEGSDVKYESATGDLEITALNIEIKGNTGTGDITLSGAQGEFDLNTGTGRIIVSGSQGDFDLNSGTGKVKISDSKGEFKANSGTGDVYAGSITINDEAEFNSGTGDVEVYKPAGADFDLTLNSGTDDATLDMGGLPISGYFEFSANARSGDIRCPVDFDQEKTYARGDHEKIVKFFTKGQTKPRFFIGTATGIARLKK